MQERRGNTSAEIRRVKLAVYNVEKMPPGADIEMPKRLTKLLEKDDWDLAARIREDDELVLVRASGHIDRLLALAMENELDVPPELLFKY